MRRYATKRYDWPWDEFYGSVGVGVEVVINGKTRRHAIVFSDPDLFGKSDADLIAFAKPHLDKWEQEERAKHDQAK